jgi:hypothetical protein
MSGQQVTRADIVAAFDAEPLISNQAVLIEEFVRCAIKKSGMPRDYKFYNFGHSCAFIHVVERNSRKDQRKNRHFFIREDRSALPYQVQRTQVHSQDELILPDCFDRMLNTARLVSASLWAFARVDLYADDQGPVFGELTQFPHGGKGYLELADIELGRHWRGIDGASDIDFIRYPSTGREMLSPG